MHYDQLCIIKEKEVAFVISLLNHLIFYYFLLLHHIYLYRFEKQTNETDAVIAFVFN